MKKYSLNDIMKKRFENVRKEMLEYDDDIDEITELANKLAALPLSEEARKVHH